MNESLEKYETLKKQPNTKFDVSTSKLKSPVKSNGLDTLIDFGTSPPPQNVAAPPANTAAVPKKASSNVMDLMGDLEGLDFTSNHSSPALKPFSNNTSPGKQNTSPSMNGGNMNGLLGFDSSPSMKQNTSPSIPGNVGNVNDLLGLDSLSINNNIPRSMSVNSNTSAHSGAIQLGMNPFPSLNNASQAQGSIFSGAVQNMSPQTSSITPSPNGLSPVQQVSNVVSNTTSPLSTASKTASPAWKVLEGVPERI